MNHDIPILFSLVPLYLCAHLCTNDAPPVEKKPLRALPSVIRSIFAELSTSELTMLSSVEELTRSRRREFETPSKGTSRCFERQLADRDSRESVVKDRVKALAGR